MEARKNKILDVYLKAKYAKTTQAEWTLVVKTILGEINLQDQYSRNKIAGDLLRFLARTVDLGGIGDDGSVAEDPLDRVSTWLEVRRNLSWSQLIGKMLLSIHIKMIKEHGSEIPQYIKKESLELVQMLEFPRKPQEIPAMKMIAHVSFLLDKLQEYRGERHPCEFGNEIVRKLYIENMKICNETVEALQNAAEDYGGSGTREMYPVQWYSNYFRERNTTSRGGPDGSEEHCKSDSVQREEVDRSSYPYCWSEDGVETLEGTSLPPLLSNPSGEITDA